MEKCILVVDDNKSIREMMQLYLTELGYSVKTAENGKVALEMMHQRVPVLLLTDIEMPILDGKELIDSVLVLPECPVIVVLTANDNVEFIVQMMQKGIFDYILKPVKKNDFKSRIERAMKMSELNRAQIITEKEKVIRLEQQLEWYRFYEKMMHKKEELDNSSLFENLHRSLSQGSGIGTMITLFDMFLMTAKKNGNVYEIDANLFDQMKLNNDVVYRAISVFSEIDRVSGDSIEFEQISLLDLYRTAQSQIKALNVRCKIAHHTIIICDEKNGWAKIQLNINQEQFDKVFEEILLNALKYSKPDSNIILLFDIKGDQCEISVLNEPRKECSEGITMAFENIIFEPFFRLVKFIQDEYETLDYGLGLTYVQRVVERHGGRVRLFNIDDFTDISRNAVVKVSCTITLPLVHSH